MKKSVLKTIALLTSFAIIACSQDIVVENTQNRNDGNAINKICITGKDFQIDDDTRSSVTIGESGASFTWDEDDVIGIFPDKGDQVSFAMDEGAGTQTATFTGGGWALKSSSKYAAYYPHVYENRDLTAIPISYIGQTQNGNANTDHIGAYDFMAASVTTPSNGAVAFDMQHLGALVQLTITVPEPSTLTKVVLNSSTEFTETGTIDLTSETPAITTENKSNAIEIALYDVVTTEANENITVYFMTAPIDLSNEELTAIICLADETILYGEITGKDLQAGKAYKLFADKLSNEPNEPEGTIPNNQIWYTNGSTTEPIQFDSDTFGTTIVSNTYNAKKGCWVITCDGYVTTIGDYAFDDCYSLTSITIPDSVTMIGEFAFGGCTSLTSVTIGDSVTTIGYWAFSLCHSLTSITIGDSVTTIGGYAFYDCSSLTSVTIPNSVTTIGDGAFYSCDSLTSVTIGDSVTTIGDGAFRGCSSLTSVYITDLSAWCKIDFEINDANPLYYANNLYLNNEFVTDLVIPSDITEIKSSTFSGFNSLTSVTIGNNVTTIGDYAFYYCSSLTSVTIPDSVTTIGDYAFYSCESLTSVTIGDSVTTIGNSAFYDCDSLTSITIGDSVTTIGYWAFADCTSLTSVTIPDSVTEIGDAAFHYCQNLTSITIPDSVTTIGKSAFSYCSRLTSVTIGDSVTTIGDGAFRGCSNLTSVTIPDSVVEVGDGAFAGCSRLSEFNGKFASSDGRCLIVNGTLNSIVKVGLTEYSIPDSVTKIGDSVFAHCNSLTSIAIPNNVTTIGNYAFEYCSNLTSITIPDSVTKIGSAAFSGCSSLTSVYCKATTPPSGGESMFGSNVSDRKIYVPMESVDSYRKSTGWSTYASDIVGYNF